MSLAPDESSALTGRSALELVDLVRAGQISVTEVVVAHLELIYDVDRELNALVVIDAEHALASAAVLDDRLRRGQSTGPLAGVPFVVKDNLDVHAQVTTSGSRSGPDVVAIADAPVVRRLRRAGAVLLGRANMDEFAMGASTQTSAFGPTRNPVDPRRSPGGSSGGSAAAVAAGLAPLSIGTDTGGSVREPASQCGIVGMAPSHGSVPMRGIAPFAPDFDRVGPLARTVADARRLLEVMRGAPLATSSSRPRVGVIAELVGRPNRDEVLLPFGGWLEELRANGIETTEVSVPDAPAALSAYMILTTVASVAWLEPVVASAGAGEEVLRRHRQGLHLLRTGSDQIERALGVRRRLQEQLAAALVAAPTLVSPTMPTTAPLLDEVGAADLADPMAAPYTDCWTVVANLARLPALSVPMSTAGLPAGAMLMGAAGSDGDLLDLAERLR